MTLPILTLVTLGLVWLLSVGIAQLRLVDAVRETARVVARGESPAAAVQIGSRIAPDGAVITVSDGDPVVVHGTCRVSWPGGLFGFLPGASLEAQAVAAAEPGS